MGGYQTQFGILPRIGVRQTFYNKAFNINNILKTLCEKENVQYSKF